MQEYLEGYLDATVTPELKGTILRARNTLLAAGIGEVEDSIGSVLSQESLAEGSLAYQLIKGVLLPQTLEALTQFEVRAGETMTLPIATEVLDGLLRIDNWDDTERLYGLCDADEPPEEVFATLIAEVTILSEEDVLLHIDSVAPSLIEKLQEILEPRLPAPVVDEAQVAALRARVQQFFNQNPAPSRGFLMVLLDGGYRLGMPSKVYYDAYVAGLPDTVDPQQAAYDLTCFVLASPTATERVLEVVAEYAEALHHDVNEVAQITRSAASLILPE
jgi:hypothetical protein